MITTIRQVMELYNNIESWYEVSELQMIEMLEVLIPIVRGVSLIDFNKTELSEEIVDYGMSLEPLAKKILGGAS